MKGTLDEPWRKDIFRTFDPDPYFHRFELTD